MRIKEICDILRAELFHNGYEYGFISNGQRYKPNMKDGFDHEYYRLSKTVYSVQDPAVTMKEKIGTCVDAVLVMKFVLDQYGVTSKIWLLYNRTKNKVHTLLTFAAEDQTVYLELTPQSSKPWYGQEIVYPSEQALIREYEDSGYDVSDVTDAVVVGEQPFFLLEKLK